MIPWKKFQYEKHTGQQHAQIEFVKPVSNAQYDPMKENSTPMNLEIYFKIFKGEREVPFTQKFVSPIKGNNLFTKLADLAGLELNDEQEGEPIDEQELVGLECIVEFKENDRGYTNIVEVYPLRTAAPAEPVATTEPKDEDYPEFLNE